MTEPASTTATTLTRTFEDDRPISLLLDNASGDVEVHLDATPGTASVVLRADREVDFSLVDLSCQDGRVTVDVPALVGPQGKGFTFALGPIKIAGGDTASVDVTVHLPAGADVTAKTRSGDITLTGVSGATKVTTGSGDLRVQESGSLKATSGSGDVVIGSCLEGVLTTGSGDVRLDVCTGPGNLQLRSGSGDIDVRTHADESVVATGSGDITLDLRAGNLNARTGTGDAEITVPHGIPVWLDLNTGLGQVTRRIDPVGAPAEGQEHLALTVRSGTGDILVRH